MRSAVTPVSDHYLPSDDGSNKSTDADGNLASSSDTGAAYDEAFAELAQIIAHRIRSLTSSIESCADMLSDVVDERDERELVMRILEGTARIEYVLSDLMLYGKPIQPTYLPLHVEDVIHGVLSLFSEEERQVIDLTSRLPGETQVSGDPNLLRQAILALVQNAIDAVGRPEASEGWIRVQAALDEGKDHVQITVTNPGTTGVENAGERLFRPFFTTKAQNLGLGLAIARRIAHVHEGSIDLVHDDPAAGTTFALALPAAD